LEDPSAVVPGSSNGKQQQLPSPAVAAAMLPAEGVAKALGDFAAQQAVAAWQK
jgi:hypothetical protein